MSESFNLKDIDIKQSDLSDDIFNEYEHLLSDEKNAFEGFIQDISSQQNDQNEKVKYFTRQRDYSNKSETYLKLIQDTFQKHHEEQQVEHAIQGNGEGNGETEELVKGSFLSSLFNPVKEFVEDLVEKCEKKLDNCIRETDVKYTLQGLDNSVIDFGKLKVVNNKLVYDDVHNNIQNITFLIAGYMNEDIDAKTNYKTIVDDKRKSESHKDFYVNFRWQSSCPISILKQFFVNLAKEFLGQSDDNKRIKDFCENYIQVILKDLNWNPIFKKFIYFIIRALLFFISSRILIGLWSLLLKLLIDLLDTIIMNFELSYEMAKRSGKMLSQVIKDIKNSTSFTPPSIDLFGHSLGTVVTQQALSNFEKPKLIRYVILMGGVATISEMCKLTQNFENCVNYYSKKDQVLDQFLIKGKILGKVDDYTGLNPFNSTDGIFIDRQLTIGHTEYNSQYSSIIDEVHDIFKINQQDESESEDNNCDEKVKRSRRQIDTPTDSIGTIPIVLGLGLGIGLLYLGYRLFKK